MGSTTACSHRDLSSNPAWGKLERTHCIKHKYWLNFREDAPVLNIYVIAYSLLVSDLLFLKYNLLDKSNHTIFVYT